jgi:hypothetical protein
MQSHKPAAAARHKLIWKEVSDYKFILAIGLNAKRMLKMQ